jgi:hypothetical protein
MKCIVNVTDREFAKILQLNHDAVVWKSSDRQLMAELEKVLDNETVNALRVFEECKMQVTPLDSNKPRVEVDNTPIEPLQTVA